MPTVRGRRQQKGGNVTRHEQLIRALLDADGRIYRNGFAVELAALLEEVCVKYGPPGLPNVVPDAYLINRENETIDIFEVEITCPMSRAKRDEYGWFWYEMDADDSHEWLPRLYSIDRYGNIVRVDMCSLYYASTGGDFEECADGLNQPFLDSWGERASGPISEVTKLVAPKQPMEAL